ncbi:hypothetical protein CAL29_13720 [Bordetella genomosp. 10]|uniref:Uncharacterized protein n=1 Tax=Bordetella genomosp. 10 TaxID=1416804 RepID=A0A261SAX7_9BORD|nr:DUF6389 family protein [Bordetella genomosp. 10]OZI34554.1 hypothetical protein CAL29_13720 [Bordetella genomosp. 10]
MTLDEYTSALDGVLQAHAGPAHATLDALIAALPPRAREIHIAVFPDQDGTGTFSIVASLDGPDMFVLNKAIEGHRYLFDVRYTERGVEPDVPLLDGGGTGFDVQDAVVDTGMRWVETLVRARDPAPLPVLIYGEEGYGTLAPIVIATEP